MLPRIAAFVIWAAAAASVVYWVLQLWARPMAVPAHAVVVSAAGGFSGDPGRVLGADAPPGAPLAAAPQAPADPRYRLIGVVAPRGAGAAGVALIATDGKPPKAYRVGSAVDGELVLLAVRPRGASLGPRGQAAQVDLQLPVLPPAAAGMRPQPAPPLAPRTPQAVPQAPAPQPQDDVETDTPPPDSQTLPTGMPPTGFVRPPA